MKIYVNGEAREVDAPYSAQQLVQEMGLAGRRIAMEVNREILPRSEYAGHTFSEGDTIEVVHAIGGG